MQKRQFTMGRIKVWQVKAPETIFTNVESNCDFEEHVIEI
jgi:hypothetical protein